MGFANLQEERVERVPLQTMHSTTLTQYHESTKTTGYYPIDFKLPVGSKFGNLEGAICLLFINDAYIQR